MGSDTPEQSYDESEWGQDGLGTQVSAEHHSDNQHSHQETQEPDFSLGNASNIVGDAATNEDYEPDSPPADPVPDIAVLIKPNKPNKPKTSAGFIVASSDGEDDEDTVPVSTRSGLASRLGKTPGKAEPQVTAAAERSSFDPNGHLEARIKADPRGDMDAWLALISAYRTKGNLDDIRGVYHRFVHTFPHGAAVWAEWIELELGMNNFVEAEALFGKCLMMTPNVQLWTVYLNYIRRRNDLTNDATGERRKTVTQAYEFVIDNIGVDKDAGRIWEDYIHFIRSGPGQIGGSNWQDQQKMDQLRKAYQRAICVPTSAVNTLWKEYDQFEMGLNKMTGRKFIQERSPSYMSAKSANIALDNMTRNLRRTTLPRLPPATGFDGDVEFMEQVDLWKRWISWEKEDHLVLKDEEPDAYRQRILHCYKQAIMELRFWPEMWVDAAEWCFKNHILERATGDESGLGFLAQGIAANPESVLLALKQADRLEATQASGDGDDARNAFADVVREPYARVLDALYDINKDLKEKEQADIVKIESASKSVEKQEDDDGSGVERDPSVPSKDERIKAIHLGYSVRTQLLSRTISFVWIALARAMRRIQGKGSVGTGGLRQVFTDARQRGRLTSDVYVAVALIESVVYKDPVGTKIFERGAKLFPEDEVFMLEYIKHLHSKDDTTNARVVFETCVNKLTQKPETLHKAKLLYGYFHKYEAQYGELSQVAKLEERIAELFPEDPSLAHFRSRYSSDKADKFDPILAPIVVSPTQLRPKTVMPSIEQPPSMHNSPAPQTRAVASPKPPHLRATNSPKRPLPADDYDDLNPPRKLARGESPLKGAAGRRLDQQRRSQASALHREITFLLGILPPASSYDTIRFNNSAMVNLIKKTHIPDYNSWKATQDQALHANGKLTRTGGLPGAPASADYSYPPYPGVPDPRQPSAGQDGTNRRLAPPATSYRQVSQGSTGGGPYDQAQGGYRQDYGSSAGPENTLGWQQPQASYQPPPPQYNRYQY